ncbi:MAG: antibiotic biosynthesis monooxygenase [Ilumatobacteraceae bacterium]
MSSTDATPIIVVGHLTVDANDRDGYLRSCENVVQAARHGCLDFAISADLVGPTRINVDEPWRNALNLEAFRDQGPDDDQMSTVIAIEVGEYQVQRSGRDT